MEEGIFPSFLKISKVIPTYKTGKFDKVVNYRPLSILPMLSQVSEKLMYNRLVKIINKHNISISHQFGFSSKLYISDAITKILDIAYHCLDDKKNIAVFLYFSKAFDAVNHSILLNKLHIYGVRGINLSCFRSYLKVGNYMFPLVKTVRASMIWLLVYPKDVFSLLCFFNLYQWYVYSL